jgi:hypothetical protein
MEESNKLARIWICSIRTFVAIAVQAGEGEILKNSEPTMLARNDVIDVKGQRDRWKQQGGNTRIRSWERRRTCRTTSRFTSYGGCVASF